MADKEKSLEMRIAEIEDKLAQMHITDDEMKAFNKVASAMGLTGDAAASAASPQPIPRSIAINRGLCRIRWNCWPCACPCINECTCGPCQAGGGGGFGGGFGGFGM